MGEYDYEFYKEEGDTVGLNQQNIKDFQFVCCIVKGKKSSTYIAKNE